MRDVWRILLLWRRRWGWLGAGIVASVAALGSGIALLGVSSEVVARALLGLGLVAALTLRVLGPVRVVMRYAERLVTHAATFRALADLRVWFFRGIAGSGAGGLGMVRSAEVLSRLVGDVETLDSLYLRIMVPLAGAILLLPLLLALAWPLGLGLAAVLGSLFAMCAFVLPLASMRMARQRGGKLAASTAGLRVAATDALTGLREVRAFGAQGRVLAQVQAREAAMLGTARALARDIATSNAAALLCAQLALLAVLEFALLAQGGRHHPVAVVALAFVTVAVFEAVAGLPRAGVLASNVTAAARRVVQAATVAPAVPEPRNAAAPPATNDLRFEAVRFAWQADRPTVFDGLTLDVPAGSRVALIGPSGSGKSTLAALALKVAAPQSGRVSLGGVDLASLAAADVRRRIGWLSQSTHLFDDSLRDNLLLARPDASDADLWAALETARIGDFVRALPDGLDSWLGEGGARVSGGQARRLVLARALLSPAPLLVLDEPCAGLDAETEREFFLTLNEAAPERSIVLIVHRLTGVERLDRIYRLSHGKAVAAAG